DRPPELKRLCVNISIRARHNSVHTTLRCGWLGGALIRFASEPDQSMARVGSRAETACEDGQQGSQRPVQPIGRVEHEEARPVEPRDVPRATDHQLGYEKLLEVQRGDCFVKGLYDSWVLDGIPKQVNPGWKAARRLA